MKVIKVLTFTCQQEQEPLSVEVKGSFDNWEKSYKMDLVSVKPQRTYAYPVEVPVTADKVEIQYKFLVDGQWTLDLNDREKRIVRDGNGNENHSLIVEDETCTVKVSEVKMRDPYEAQRVKPTKSFVDLNNNNQSGSNDLLPVKEKGGCIIL